jgi:hypothetical protein
MVRRVATSRPLAARRHHCDPNTRPRHMTRSTTPSDSLTLRYVLHLIDASFYRSRRSGATSVDRGRRVSLVSPGSNAPAPASICYDQPTSRTHSTSTAIAITATSTSIVTFVLLRFSTDTARTLPSPTVSRRSPFSCRLPGVLPPSTILAIRPWASRAFGG